MRCESCNDDGMVVLFPTRPDGSLDMQAIRPQFVPCPVCGGSKITHCCEGDIAEPCEMDPREMEPRSKAPDYIYDPDEWDCTYRWDDRDDLMESLEPYPGEVAKLGTLVEGPPVFLVRVVKTRDEHGDPDETEDRLFFDEAEAHEASKR